MVDGRDNLIEAVRADVRARPCLWRVCVGLAFVLFIVGTVFWDGMFRRAPRQLELWVDARAVPEFSLQHGNVAVPPLSFPLRYPAAVQDWEVTIEALGDANPAAWDAQVWVQSIRTPEQALTWADVELGAGWELVDSPFGMGGKAAVSKGRGATRSLSTRVRGSELQIVYSRNAWNGRMRITAGDRAEVVDTWQPGFTTGTFTQPARPGPDDVLEGHHLSRTVTLDALGGGGRLAVVPDAGELKVTRARLDGRELPIATGRTREGGAVQTVRVPSGLWLALLPAAGIGLVGALAGLLVLPLLLRLVQRWPFAVGVAAVSGLKLWMISQDEIRANLYDSRGYMLRALDWVWGGPFGLHDYERQPVYPLLIALNRLSGIPLRVTLDLLYMGACLLVALALPRFRVPRWAAFVAFALMALHPLTLPVFAFGYQDVAYTPVYLLALGGLLHTLGTTSIRRATWACVAGMGIALSWNARPEHILLVGLLAVFALLVGGLEWLRDAPPATRLRPRLRRIGRAAATAGLTLVPTALLTLAITLAFAAMGQRVMGTFATCNFQMPGFSALYNELLAIEPQDARPYWPVPADARERAYAASPTFAQLRTYMEGPVLDSYAPMAEGATDVRGDFGPFFFWGLRVAPWYMKRWETAGELDRFYQQAADELHQARKGGLYPSRTVYAPFIEPQVHLWLPYVPQGMRAYWGSLAPWDVERMAPEDEGVEPAVFDRAALRRAAPAASNQALWNTRNDPSIRAAKRATARIVTVGTWAGTILTPLALLACLWRFIRRRSAETLLPLALLVLLAAAFISRFLLVSVMHAVAFGAEGRYILPVAPLLPLLAVVAGVFIYRGLRPGEADSQRTLNVER